ncbi:phosphoethanolamine transferase CptA [Salmonella enterica]|uniref:phosphoethanolamine transferase CptA n=1 Tax=Salmonella enterica TaxID=28901 RepID=UPI0012CBC86F|nr:phosphoethanolamine transferase CptA [Salmonella enterica subsp. enterica serovar Lomalinda]EDU0501827.1 phosphoethanolamine transferase CptA [Salmonella enterica subsp. salamae]EEI9684496.1 phosphoethanolamine transferase CptA [Salmonella enterica]ECI5321499.1 phosphoethanolamine transferase CptA [Salmonella enterica subsp. enterica serovar Lomalinda]EDV1507008.1 phosphoethanolamine transferase CptA [Salmonella enterica subsp. salamae]
MLSIQSGHIIFSWSALIWILLFFWYFSTLLQLYILASGHSGTNGFRDSLLYSTAWLIPVFLFPDYMFPITAITGMVLWITSIFSLAYYVIYQQEFSQSVLFIVFDSNPTEAREYFSQYFSLKLAVILVLYTIGGLWLWSHIELIYIPLSWRYITAFAIFYILFGHIIIRDLIMRRRPASQVIAHIMSRTEPAAPWQIVMAYCQYRVQSATLKNLMKKNDSLPHLKNLSDNTGNEPRTLVLILGESTQRNRMSLYGYGRITTPLLDEIRRQDPHLTVFDDVISPRPYTIEVLQQILTFADEKNPDLYLTQPSLINIMRQVGYKSFWITNQQTMTRRNTMLMTFSEQTDKQYYMNHQRTQSSRQYDDVVFEPFREALADPAPKKLIIVHLLGTHINYKYRFPKSYERFKGYNTVVPSGLSAINLKTYNDYDNANLYNDYVVSTLIKEYAANNPHGFLIYFSDHGEEVYDTPPYNIQGRNETAPTANMYTVPYIQWVSPSWQRTYPHDYSSCVNRKYSLSHFIHTWSEMAGLYYEGWCPEKSVINRAFTENIRWIGDPYKNNGLLNFDYIFKNDPTRQ